MRGRIDTSISDARNAVVHAQKDRSCLGPIETCYSGPEGAVLHGKTTGGVWDPETCNSRPKVAFFHAQNHRCWLEPI